MFNSQKQNGPSTSNAVSQIVTFELFLHCSQSSGCPPDKWGSYCLNQCHCDFNNTQACDVGTGRCACTPGWTGDTCSETCQTPYYGDACAEICTCNNDAECDHVSGRCICQPGYIGDT